MGGPEIPAPISAKHGTTTTHSCGMAGPTPRGEEGRPQDSAFTRRRGLRPQTLCCIRPVKGGPFSLALLLKTPRRDARPFWLGRQTSTGRTCSPWQDLTYA